MYGTEPQIIVNTLKIKIPVRYAHFRVGPICHEGCIPSSFPSGSFLIGYLSPAKAFHWPNSWPFEGKPMHCMYDNITMTTAFSVHLIKPGIWSLWVICWVARCGSWIDSLFDNVMTKVACDVYAGSFSNERFHMTSPRLCWCTKTKNWCTRLTL